MSGTASSGKSGKRDAGTREGNAQKESEGSKEATETTRLLKNGNKDKGNMCKKLMSCCFPCYKDEKQASGTVEVTNATETSICAEPHTSTRQNTPPTASDSAPLDVKGSDGAAASGKHTMSVGTSTDSHVIMPPDGSAKDLKQERRTWQTKSSNESHSALANSLIPYEVTHRELKYQMLYLLELTEKIHDRHSKQKDELLHKHKTTMQMLQSETEATPAGINNLQDDNVNEPGTESAGARNLQEEKEEHLKSSPENDNYSNIVTGLNPLSKYLGSLAQRIGKDGLDIILFHAERLDLQPICKRDREKIQDALTLFGKLQELGHINESNCNTLVHLLEAAQLETLATEVTVRYEIGFKEVISDSDLKERVNSILGKSEQAKGQVTKSSAEPDSSLPERFIPCETCQTHFKEQDELERKYAKAKFESKHFLQIAIQERNNAEMQLKNAKLKGNKEHDHCEKAQEELTRVLAKSKSYLIQLQDRLGLAIQGKESLEKQLEIAKKKAEIVQDFHKKEKESLEVAKSKCESISQEIQDKLDRVIEERTRLEMQLAQTKQEVAKVPDLEKENENIKIAHIKLEVDMKQTEEKLGRIIEERNILKQQLQKKEDVEKKLMEACTKSKSDLTQVQDKLDKAIQERGTLERKLEMTNKEVKRVQDFHNKEMENVKSKSESVSQQIQSKLERVIEERTRLEMQLAETKQEVAKVPDLQKENEQIKIAHDKLEADMKQMEEKLDREMQEKIIHEQRLEKTKKELSSLQDLYKEAQEKIEKLIAEEKRRSKVEAKPIGGTKYIGEKEKLEGRMAGQGKQNNKGNATLSKSTSNTSTRNTGSNSSSSSTSSCNNPGLLRSIYDSLKLLHTKIDQVSEEQKKIKATLLKSAKMQITQFEVRKGSYEYNTLVSLLAKLYLNKPTREVPRQEIYDKIKEEFGDYNVNAIRKMMTFCQRKVSEWKQEEVRKITSVEDDKRHLHQMDTLSLAESVCQPKMVNVTPKIMYALSLIVSEKVPEGRGAGTVRVLDYIPKLVQ